MYSYDLLPSNRSTGNVPNRPGKIEKKLGKVLPSQRPNPFDKPFGTAQMKPEGSQQGVPSFKMSDFGQTGMAENSFSGYMDNNQVVQHKQGEPVGGDWKGADRTMPSHVRSKMEGVFNTDFSGLKLSEGPGASAMGAKAYAQGNHIQFAKGQYDPNSRKGQELLGHELTHVVQQREGKVKKTAQIQGVPINDDASLEKEASQMGRKAAASDYSITAGSRGGSQSGIIQNKAQQSVMQLEAGDGVKNKDNFKVFTPVLGKAVGVKGANQPEDVKTIQKLLKGQGYDSVMETGAIDDVTIAAIKAFQKKTFPKWKTYDGTVDVGKQTWEALTHAYFNPDDTDRERKQFGKKRSVMFSPADISKAVSGTLAFVKDNDKDLKDDVIEWNRQSADKASGVDNVPVSNISHVIRVLQQFYDQGISIDTLIFSSHGSYRRHAFMIGNETITMSEISRLKPLKNLLSPNTKLVVMACHVGGGSDPTKAKAYAKKLAETLGVTVYTSRSWSIGTKNLFNVGKKGKSKKYSSYYGDPDDYAAADIKKRPNVYKFLGQWLETTPGEKETKSKVVNALEMKPDGTFTIADERFENFSDDDKKVYDKLISDMDKKK